MTDIERSRISLWWGIPIGVGVIAFMALGYWVVSYALDGGGDASPSDRYDYEIGFSGIVDYDETDTDRTYRVQGVTGNLNNSTFECKLIRQNNTGQFKPAVYFEMAEGETDQLKQYPNGTFTIQGRLAEVKYAKDTVPQKYLVFKDCKVIEVTGK